MTGEQCDHCKAFKDRMPFQFHETREPITTASLGTIPVASRVHHLCSYQCARDFAESKIQKPDENSRIP